MFSRDAGHPQNEQVNGYKLADPPYMAYARMWSDYVTDDQYEARGHLDNNGNALVVRRGSLLKTAVPSLINIDMCLSSQQIKC